MEIPIFLVPTLIKIENGNRDFAYIVCLPQQVWSMYLGANQFFFLINE